MGNAHAKESRSGRSHQGGLDAGAGASSQDRPISRSRRASRPELAVLGLIPGSSSSNRQQQQDSDSQPFERRETKQEREARRLERERAARIKERERSVKEENVDGGYLVTMGVYTASEDFNKAVARQLQIERRLAPFWRGLDDVKDTWAEHQIIAAARGLEIPPVDEVPEHLVPQPLPPTESPGQSSQNLNNLTVPLGPRTLSAASDKTASNPGSSLPSPTTAGPTRSPGSPLKPHKKALAAALSISSRSGSQTDITPREINLPHDPFVNGQPLEVFLYKDATECPVCFLYYPPYLNRTRCCDQAICSECFIQIKRPDPHLPEHHGENNEPNSNPDALNTSADPEEVAGELISEPACCPYCTAPDFGVTYEPPPFRRGLTYTYNPSSLGAMGTAMSSTSSLNSNLSPTSATAPSQFGRRRAQSLSANAPGVVTTDRVRPDWSTKLAAARAHQRRRAAAADALHHAAFVMSQVENSRGGLFGRSGRFGRRNTGNREGDSPGGTNNGSGSVTPSPLGPEPGPRSSSGRTGPSRERIDAAHLESMMMAEAIRLSLADEEERRRKAEKEAKKEAKKKEKEERKAAKRRTDVYGGSGSGASSSSLSLGLGRRRGNSAASNLRVEASVAAAANASSLQSQAEDAEGEATAKGKEVDRGSGDNNNDPADSQGLSATSVGSLPIPNPQNNSHSGRGPSHLRQMSNASSVSSSEPGSYMSHGLHAQDPRSSGLSLAGRSEDGEASATEPLFNFRSLAEMVGVSVDGEEEAQTPGSDQVSPGSKNGDGPAGEHVEHIERVDGVGPAQSTDKDDNQTIKVDTSATGQGTDSSMSPPHVMITPETPAPLGPGDEESKRLGHVDTPEAPHQATQ